jgi:hypothetical protein
MRIEIGNKRKINFPAFVHAPPAYDHAINRTLLIGTIRTRGID